MARQVSVDAGRFANDAESAFGPLNSTQRRGLTSLVDRITQDPDVSDIRWASYMLATVKHECANRWQPIGEFGHGQGHPYGIPVKIVDSHGGNHTNIYYGRGYVQLTWDQNYKKMSTAIFGDDRLWVDPDEALDPDTAYKIMSYGMRHGSFTGKKLADFISGNNCDYIDARTIINGHDQAPLIAGYAETFETISLSRQDRETTEICHSATPNLG